MSLLTTLLPGPQNLSLLVVGVGAVFSLLFHLGTREGRRRQVDQISGACHKDRILVKI